MKNNAAVMGAYFLLGAVRYGLLGGYLLWALSVLKYSNGTNNIDAQELLVIYPLSVVGAVVILSTLRKRIVQLIER
jgi:hypothetical protein